MIAETFETVRDSISKVIASDFDSSNSNWILTQDHQIDSVVEQIASILFFGFHINLNFFGQTVAKIKPNFVCLFESLHINSSPLTSTFTMTDTIRKVSF